MRQLDLMAAHLSAQGLDGPMAALAQMAGRIQAQAAVMSFGDIFLLITCLFAGLALVALLMKNPAPGKAAPAH